MAVFLGAKGADILSTMKVGALLSEIQEKLNGKLAYLQSGEHLALYQGLRTRVDEELALEREFSTQFQSTMADLARSEYPDQLPEYHACLKQLVREHFLRRRSVVAFHSLATAVHDLLISKAFAMAQSGAAFGGSEGQIFPCSLVASGRAGRRELSLTSGCRYLIIHESPGQREHFEALRYRLIAILRLCGSIWAESSVADSVIGLETEGGWQQQVRAQTEARDRLGDALAELGDQRAIVGDETAAGRLKAFAMEAMLARRKTDAFVSLARKLSTMPVALGRFGSFKTARLGEHRGEFNIDEAALAPLVSNVRVLAIYHGHRETGTVERIKALVNSGHLGVELAERLLKAYHVLTSQRLHKELETDSSSGDNFYLDPEQLSEEEQHRVKGSLETVVNLQRIVYQVFAEQG